MQTTLVFAKDSSSLIKVQRVFSFAQEFALLSLKPSKCQIVALNPLDPKHEDGERGRDVIHEWLAVRLLVWSDFVIAREYTIVHLGPKSYNKSWTQPIGKWTTRSGT